VSEISFQVRIVVHDTAKVSAPTNEQVEVDIHRAIEHRMAAVTHGEISVRSERLDK
jgi:hypothetical protein